MQSTEVRRFPFSKFSTFVYVGHSSVMLATFQQVLWTPHLVDAAEFSESTYNTFIGTKQKVVWADAKAVVVCFESSLPLSEWHFSHHDIHLEELNVQSTWSYFNGYSLACTKGWVIPLKMFTEALSRNRIVCKCFGNPHITLKEAFVGRISSAAIIHSPGRVSKEITGRGFIRFSWTFPRELPRSALFNTAGLPFKGFPVAFLWVLILCLCVHSVFWFQQHYSGLVTLFDPGQRELNITFELIGP